MSHPFTRGDLIFGVVLQKDWLQVERRRERLVCILHPPAIGIIERGVWSNRSPGGENLLLLSRSGESVGSEASSTKGLIDRYDAAGGYPGGLGGAHAGTNHLVIDTPGELGPHGVRIETEEVDVRVGRIIGVGIGRAGRRSQVHHDNECLGSR